MKQTLQQLVDLLRIGHFGTDAYTNDMIWLAMPQSYNLEG